MEQVWARTCIYCYAWCFNLPWCQETIWGIGITATLDKPHGACQTIGDVERKAETEMAGLMAIFSNKMDIWQNMWSMLAVQKRPWSTCFQYKIDIFTEIVQAGNYWIDVQNHGAQAPWTPRGPLACRAAPGPGGSFPASTAPWLSLPGVLSFPKGGSYKVALGWVLVSVTFFFIWFYGLLMLGAAVCCLLNHCIPPRVRPIWIPSVSTIACSLASAIWIARIIRGHCLLENCFSSQVTRIAS